MFLLDKKRIRYDAPLGIGGFGETYSYESSKSGTKDWVIKIVKPQTLMEQRLFFQEVALGFNHHHPFIVSVQGYHIEEESGETGLTMYLKMPRMKIDMAHMIKKHASGNGFPKDMIIRSFYRIANALEYLERKKIAHRDIKPSNILQDKQGEVYLADLGLSKLVSDDVTISSTFHVAGTREFLAPEYTRPRSNPLKKKDLFRGDVWSLGLTMLDICLCENRVQKMLEKNIENISNQLERVAQRYGEELKDVLAGLLVVNPEERMTFSDVCSALEKSFPKELESTIDILIDNAQIFQREIIFKKMKEPSSQTIRGILTLAEKMQSDWRFSLNHKFAAIPKNPLVLSDGLLENFVKDFKENFQGDIQKTVNTILLGLSWCKNLTDEGLNHLKFDSLQFENITNFTLNLYGCSKVTDNGIKSLSCQTLEAAKSLKTLYLDFSGLTNITNKGVGELVTSISSNCKKLQNLSIKFRGCPEIGDTDENMLSLITYLKGKLKYISKISLDFTECERVTDKARDILIKC